MRVEEKQDLNEHDFTRPISWGKNYPWGYKSIMSFGFFDSHQLKSENYYQSLKLLI